MRTIFENEMAKNQRYFIFFFMILNNFSMTCFIKDEESSLAGRWLSQSKRFLSWMLVGSVMSLFSFPPLVLSATFPDTEGHWAESYIDDLAEQGVISGYENGNFGPDDRLTRAQFAKIAVLAFLGEAAVDPSDDADFTDVDPDSWYEDYVNTAAEHGIVSGYKDINGNLTGEFGPNDYATRAQVTKMVLNAADLEMHTEGAPHFPDVFMSAWYYEYVETAYWWGIINGYESGDFGPADGMTRGQASKVTSLAQDPQPRDEEDDDNQNDDDLGKVGGTLDVSLSADSPEDLTVPSQANSVEIGTWEFTAMEEDITLDALVLSKFGVGDFSSGYSLYLFEDNVRLTSGRTVSSSSQTVEFRSLDLEIEEGKTRSLSLRATLSNQTTTGEVGFELENLSSIESSAELVEGDFPIVTDLFTLSTTAVGTLTIEPSGSLSDPEVGENNVIIARFNLSASTENADLQELGLFLEGSIDSDDIDDFDLYASGDDDTPIARVDEVDRNGVIRFEIDEGYRISQGSSENFYVRADLNTGQVEDTIEVYVDEEVDILAMGGTYGYGMSVNFDEYDGDNCTSTSGDCSYLELEGGDITISSDGPAATDIAIDADDVVLLNFTISATSTVMLEDFPISLQASENTGNSTQGLISDASDTPPNFRDIKLIDREDGSVIAGPIDSESLNTTLGGSTRIGEEDDTLGYFVFNEEITVSGGGELDLALTVDIANEEELAGMTLVGSLPLSTTYPEIRNEDDDVLNNTNSLVPVSTITGKTMTLEAPSLSISKASTPVSGATTAVKGTEDVDFLGIVFECGQVSDCVITSLTLTGYIDEEGGTNFVAGSDNGITVSQIVGSLELVDAEGTLVASRENVSSTTGKVIFDDFSWTIPSGEAEIIYARGDVSLNAFVGEDAESISFSIDASSDILVEDEQGRSLEVSGSVNASQTTYVVTSAGGALTIEVSPETPEEDILVAGTSNVVASTFDFRSGNEDFVVESLSINNRQSGVEANDLGDYDNNIDSITLHYPNQLGGLETKTAFLVNGTASFSDMNFYIGEDEEETLQVLANLNPISEGASSGELVRLNLAFNNFEAVAQSSGETYTAAKMDASVDAAVDLDFGTITYQDGDERFDLDGAQTVSSSQNLGNTLTLTIDSNAAGENSNKLPIGTMVCVDDDDNAQCENEDIYIVTNWPSSTSGTEDVVTLRLVDDAGDGSYSDNTPLLYSLPGSGYLTAVRTLHVHATKPTIALSDSSATGDRTVSTSDTVFNFEVSADEARDVTFSPHIELTTCMTGSGVTVTGQNTNISVDGSACELTNVNATNEMVIYNTTANLFDYDYVYFWFRWSDDDGNSMNLLPEDLVLFTSDNNDGVADQTVALSSANVVGSPNYLVENTWYMIKDVPMPADTGSDDYIGLSFQDSNALAANDEIYLDRFLVYNEKIELKLSSDADFDRLYDQSSTSGTRPTVAYLRENGSTVATGYIDVVSVDANGDGVEDATDGSLAVVVFTPSSEEGFEIGEGTTETFSMVTNTTALLSEDSSQDDPLTIQIDLGSSSNGMITPGGFWWNDGYQTVRWLGDVDNSTLSGNTVTY